jgi:hypothetical protein
VVAGDLMCRARVRDGDAFGELTEPYRREPRRSAGRRRTEEWDVPDVEPPEPTRLGEVVWLEPFPDAVVEGALGPEARYEQTESLSLAVVTALPSTTRAETSWPASAPRLFRAGRRFDLVPTRADGQPAFGANLRAPARTSHGSGLFVLTLTGHRNCVMTHFDRSVLPSFGLPRSLPSR